MYKKACAYDIPAEQVDGMDPLATYEVIKKAAEHCRSGKGPYLVEALTFRYRGHSMADPEQYREKKEVEEWRPRDPIPAFRANLIEHGVLTEKQASEIEAEIEAQLEDAVKFADESPEPDPATIYDHLYSPGAIEQFGGKTPEAESDATPYGAVNVR
jgi:pyruvate dehydrogenase E1 component alpha subunit